MINKDLPEPFGFVTGYIFILAGFLYRERDMSRWSAHDGRKCKTDLKWVYKVFFSSHLYINLCSVHDGMLNGLCRTFTR